MSVQEIFLVFKRENPHSSIITTKRRNFLFGIRTNRWYERRGRTIGRKLPILKHLFKKLMHVFPCKVLSLRKLNNAFPKQRATIDAKDKTTVFLVWSRRYKDYSRVVSTNWLTVRKYQFLKCHWIFSFFFPLSQTLILPDLTMLITRLVSNNKQDLLTGSSPGA